MNLVSWNTILNFFFRLVELCSHLTMMLFPFFRLLFSIPYTYSMISLALINCLTASYPYISMSALQARSTTLILVKNMSIEKRLTRPRVFNCSHIWVISSYRLWSVVRSSRISSPILRMDWLQSILNTLWKSHPWCASINLCFASYVKSNVHIRFSSPTSYSCRS